MTTVTADQLACAFDVQNLLESMYKPCLLIMHHIMLEMIISTRSNQLNFDDDQSFLTLSNSCLRLLSINSTV